MFAGVPTTTGATETPSGGCRRTLDGTDYSSRSRFAEVFVTHAGSPQFRHSDTRRYGGYLRAESLIPRLRYSPYQRSAA